jgi:hypothetical protein
MGCKRSVHGSKLLESIERKYCGSIRTMALLSKSDAVPYWQNKDFIVTSDVDGWKTMVKTLKCSR